jgi:hypothetical protein
LWRGRAQAGPVTFAQFGEANGTNDFGFTNNGSGTGTFTAPSSVFLTFFSGNIPAFVILQPLPVVPVLAILTRTGTVNAPATCVGSCTTPGAEVTQTLTDSILTIRLQSDNSLLLESFGTGASLFGSIGARSATLQNSEPPNNLDFTSDYINFASAITTGRSVSFSSVRPGISVGSDGLLNSFTAAANGTFSVELVSTPAPSTSILGATGLVMIGFLTAFRRRATSL